MNLFRRNKSKEENEVQIVLDFLHSRENVEVHNYTDYILIEPVVSEYTNAQYRTKVFFECPVCKTKHNQLSTFKTYQDSNIGLLKRAIWHCQCGMNYLRRDWDKVEMWRNLK